MRKPDAILFDLWGTLILSDGFDPGKGNAALLALADNPRGIALEQVQELGNRVVSDLELREERSSIEFTWQELQRILTDSFGLRFRRSLEELEWAFWCAAMEIRLTEGVREMLAGLERRGIRRGVVSNSSFTGATLERELERLRIRDAFEFVISSADYGVRKPDTIIFEVALRRMGIDAGKAWFAGDNVGYDIIGASDAGLFAVAYNASGPVPERITDYRAIAHWSELAELLDREREG